MSGPPKKRGRPPKKTSGMDQALPSPPHSAGATTLSSAAQPRRGRRSKNAESVSEAFRQPPAHAHGTLNNEAKQSETTPALARKRGRPPKISKVNADADASSASSSSDPVRIEDNDADVDAAFDVNQILPSVVKIFCTFTKPNFSSPWQMSRQETCTSSGFVIENRYAPPLMSGHRFLTSLCCAWRRRILCNAHGVAFHSSVRVRRHGSAVKHLAKVIPFWGGTSGWD